MGPVIDQKILNFQEIIRFLAKIQLYLNLYALKGNAAYLKKNYG